MTGEDGNTDATYGYTAYGNNNDAEFTGLDKPDPANPDKDAYNPYRFNAKRWDAATSTYDMGFRNYSPGLNRFLTRDMYNGALADMNLATDSATGNRYAFTGGNPTTNIELDGHRYSSLEHQSTGDAWMQYDAFDSPQEMEEAVAGFEAMPAGDGWDFLGGVADAVIVEPVKAGADLLDPTGTASGKIDEAQSWAEDKLGIDSTSRRYSAGQFAVDIVSGFRGLAGAAVRNSNRIAGSVDDVGDAAASCRRNSFTADTKVLYADGTTKPIDEVEIGDKIIATDPETGETSVETVTDTITGKGSKNLVEITIDIDGKRGDKQATVTATDGHPFWVPELDEWVDATNLATGQWLQTSAGTHIQITAIKRWTTQATVYNLTVSDLHTYYVLAGTASILVHNCGPNADAPSASSGVATVHLDRPNEHALITVRSGDEVLSTHQFGGVDLPANGVATFDPAILSPATINVRIPLPNAEGAMAYAEVMMSRTARGAYPAYNLESQSCVTYCAQALRAGGVTDIPLDTFSATRWLIRRHG